MVNLKTYNEWLLENKEETSSEKIQLDELELSNSYKQIFDKFCQYLSNKINFDFEYIPIVEEFNQNNSKEIIYGVRFISKNLDIFRLNWVSSNFSLTNVYSVDFWFDDKPVPSLKVFIETPNMIKLVSMIVEVLESNYNNDSFNVESFILNTVEMENGEGVLKESLNDEENIEYNKLKDKYKKSGKDSLDREEIEKLIYYQIVRLGYRDIADVKLKTQQVKSEKPVKKKSYDRIQRLIERLNNQETNVQLLFSDMEKLITSVVLGDTNSLIITGTAGIGKSEALKTVMNKFDYQEGRDYRLVKGAATAYGAYREFYMYRDNKLIIFDDCDDLFGNTTAINILKGVLDTSKKRVVSWISNSTFSKEGKSEEEIKKLLKSGRIPNTFEFTSGIVFITNLLKEDILADEELQALISRSTMIDVTLNHEQLMKRIEYIISKIDLGISEDEKNHIFDVMLKAYEKGLIVGKLDVRTFIKMAQLKKTSKYFQGNDVDDDEWIRLAITYST